MVFNNRRAAATLAVALMSSTPAVLAQLAPGPRPAVPGGITDKPYLKNFQGGIALGGYMDHVLSVTEGSSTFDQMRFIPFIFAQPVDYIHVSAEIEFEHGGFVAGDEETDGEIKLEYAIIDWVVADALNFRGGVILSPLGKFNLIHDSPLNDLTNRPVVTRELIPTTLSESGMGIYGAAYPGDWVVGYEAYIVNGFNDGILDAERQLRVRGGRGSQKTDNNNDKSVVARLSMSPRLGADFGVSVHTGNYDSAGTRRLTIAAIDGDWRHGPLQVLGEAGIVSVPEAPLYEIPPYRAHRQAGFYAQANYHFGFGAIHRYPDGVFTGVVRYEWIDFDPDRDGDDRQYGTVGINFRPVEGTVVKLDHRREWMRARNVTAWSKPADLFSFSVATYF